VIGRRGLARSPALFLLGAVPAGLIAAWLFLKPIQGIARAAVPCRACRDEERGRPAPPPEPEGGYVRLGKPKPGEWLDRFHEPGQTFDEYAAGPVNQKCAHRTTLYLQPLESAPGRPGLSPHGEKAWPGTVERMREYAEIYFGLPAKVLPPIPLFPETLHPGRDQYDGDRIIARLADRLPADALVLVGITKEDLTSGSLNFVFGVGSLSSRTGVYSLRRYETPDGTLFLRRALKLMTHESGHILSIEHCAAFECVMQGANSLAEDDGHPLHPCPEDLRKLEWNAGFDRLDRYARLRAFFRENGLAAEADWVDRRLRR
jgi:archaemetzincin